MPWIGYLSASVALALVFVLGGFVVLLADISCRSLSSVILSRLLLLGLFCFIFATLLSPFVGFGLIAIGIVILVVLFAFTAAFALFERGQFVDSHSRLSSMGVSASLFAGLAANFCFLLLVFSCSGLTPDHLVQQYDNPFHFSVVRHILDTGNASPIGAGSVMGSATAVYPDVWHSLTALLVSLFGLDIQTAGWIVVLAFVGFIAPIGFHDLYLRLERNPSRCGEMLSVVLPVALPLSALEFSYWGSLYANVLGLCVLPAASVMVLDAFDRDASISIPMRIFGVLIAFAVVGLCHPNTVFVLGIFCLLYLVRLLPSVGVKLIAFIAALALWIVCCFLPMFSRTINCADRIGAGVDKGTALFSKLHLDYSFLVSHEWILWAVLAIWLVCVVAAGVRSKLESQTIPYLLGIVLLAALSFVALFPQTLFAKYVVGFWYRDFKRLLVTTLFMGSLLMPIIVDAACAFISGHFRHSDFVLRPLYIGAAAVVTLAFAAVGFHYYSSRLSPTGDCVNGVGYAQLTDGDRAFFSKVSKVVGDKALLNSYNDSSVWLYSLYHVNALIKGRPANQISSMSDDLYEVVSNVALAGGDSAEGTKMRASLRRLNVEYVLQYESQQNSTTKFKPNGQIDYQLAGKNSVVNDDTPGFEKVLTDGRYTLYKLHES